MPAGEGQERERFAAAVERGLAAVPPGDDELRRDLELVALLRESGAAMGPSADASARMRARIMAGAASMMSEPRAEQSSGLEHADHPVDAVPGADAPTVLTSPVSSEPTLVAEVEPQAPTEEPPAGGSNVVSIGRARGRHRFPNETPRAGQRRGALGVSAAAAVMVLAVTGGGAMFSQGALPGDSLYGFKQTTESALVGLTPGQGNKAQRQLDYAATRIDEVEQLNGQPASGPAGANKGADISQALKGFNDQTESGSRMWLANSGSSNSAELGALANWAQSQNQRLASMRTSMPASAQPDADHSMRLLEDLRTRAQSLSNRQGCDKVTSGDTDSLGPIPAKGACSLKESASAPPTKSVLPSAPNTSQFTGPSSSESDSGSESSSSRKDDDESTKPSKSEDPDVPGIPGLSDLTGGNGSRNVPALPGREPARSNELVPSSKEQKPGLNLPLPLLPILIQPLNSGLTGKSNG